MMAEGVDSGKDRVSKQNCKSMHINSTIRTSKGAKAEGMYNTYSQRGEWFMVTEKGELEGFHLMKN